MEHTLIEIVGVIGTPLTIDVATQNRTFGHFDEVLIEREG